MFKFLVFKFLRSVKGLLCLGMRKKMYYFAEKFWFQSFSVRKNHRQKEGWNEIISTNFPVKSKMGTGSLQDVEKFETN